jgi:nucleotide-binding universal stress UspA family protein
LREIKVLCMNGRYRYAIRKPEEHPMTRPIAFVPLETYPEPSSERAVANAVALAAGLGADIHALALLIDIPKVSNMFSNLLLDLPAMIRKAEAESRATGGRLLAAIEAAAKAAGVGFDKAELTDEQAAIADSAAASARYYDFAILGIAGAGPSGHMLAEAVVFGSGRPAVLVPDAWQPRPIRHVAIAWDGSRVAARAAADAGFLIARAEKVSVLTVFDEKPLPGKDIGERLAATLRRPGLAVEVARIAAEDTGVGETLQGHALDLGADLLVMGGYGHSRIRDFVLGGATQGVLHDTRMPILLSH